MIKGGLPVVLALVTAVWVRRMSNVKRIVAIVAGFTGIAVNASPAIWTNPNTGELTANVRGVIYLLAAVLDCAIGSNLVRPLRAEFAPARLISRAQLTATIWTLPVALPRITNFKFRGV